MFFLSNEKIESEILDQKNEILTDLRSFEFKETQTDEPEGIVDLIAEEKPIENKEQPSIEPPTTVIQETLDIDELKLNLRIKENLIDTFNDTLVLKEAEIARLKTKIAMMERRDIINELNNE